MPNIKELKLFASEAPYQLYRYGLDWDKQFTERENAVSNWDAREPGSLKAVMNAYAYVIPMIEEKERFNLDSFKIIHKLCTENVKLDSYQENSEESLVEPGELRGFGKWHGGLFARFSIDKTTCSSSGITELLQAQENGDCYCPILWCDTPADKDYIEREIAKDGFEISGFRAGFTWEDCRKLNANIQSLIPWPPEDTFNIRFNPKPALSEQAKLKVQELINQELSRWQINFTQKLETVISEFYQEMDLISSENKDQQLYAIISFVQHLERIHPFWDANLRTFCLVILNALLMQNDFAPSLIDNLLKFNGYSVNELVILVKDGMKRTEALYNHVLLNKNSDISLDNWMNIPLQKRQEFINLAFNLIERLTEKSKQMSNNAPMIISQYNLVNSLFFSNDVVNGENIESENEDLLSLC